MSQTSYPRYYVPKNQQHFVIGPHEKEWFPSFLIKRKLFLMYIASRYAYVILPVSQRFTDNSGVMFIKVVITNRSFLPFVPELYATPAGHIAIH